MTWDEIVAQAQEEGEVTWFVWYFQPQYRELAAAFTEEYGIEVVIPEGTTSGQSSTRCWPKPAATRATSTCWPWGSTGSTRWTPPTMLIGPLVDVLPEWSADASPIWAGIPVRAMPSPTGATRPASPTIPRQLAFEDAPQTIEDFEAFFAANPGMLRLQLRKRRLGPVVLPERRAQRHRCRRPISSTARSPTKRWRCCNAAWDWFNWRTPTATSSPRPTPTA
jgi:putative spermidine/putrescine transport system substrate-binding protein